MDNKFLIEKAIEAKKNSYSPYSDFKVGATVLTESNKIYTGCNIESVSFSPTICAERTAIAKAVSDGERKIAAIAVVGDSEWTYPCGVCRQVIREFADEKTIIIIAKSIDEYKEYRLDQLLPHSFGPKDLK